MRTLLLLLATAVVALAVDEATRTKSGFAVHTAATAPAESKPALEGVRKFVGFVPSLAAVMSESPALLNGYIGTQEALERFGKLTPEQVNLVQLAIAVENECRYCVAGHSMLAKAKHKTDDALVGAVRTGGALADAKLEALRSFALSVFERRGKVGAKTLQEFLDAGFTRRHALDVVACVAAKVMSNFTNGLAGTPIDKPMRPFAEGLAFQD